MTKHRTGDPSDDTMDTSSTPTVTTVDAPVAIMRKLLVTAVIVAAASAVAVQAHQHAKPFRTAFICTKSGFKSAGLTKICYYDCGGSEAATTVAVYEACARWTPRWRLKRNIQFGPRETAR
jgi:hypothetical protein